MKVSTWKKTWKQPVHLVGVRVGVRVRVRVRVTAASLWWNAMLASPTTCAAREGER